jgi:hypothetical protein
MSKLDWQLLPIYTLFILAILVVGTALSKDSGREEEIKCTQATVDANQDIRIEQLEKEIRILKTDIMLLQKGAEEE